MNMLINLHDTGVWNIGIIIEERTKIQQLIGQELGRAWHRLEDRA